MFAYCGNSPVMRFDPSGLLHKLFEEIEEIIGYSDDGLSISSAALIKSADDIASTASKLHADSIIGGGVYVCLPNELSSKLISKSNSLRAVGDCLETAGKITTAISMGMEIGETAGNIYNNINNDDLILSRKITDSIVDYYVAVYSIGLPIAAGIIGSAIGGPVVGSVSSIAVDGLVGAIFEKLLLWIKLKTH